MSHQYPIRMLRMITGETLIAGLGDSKDSYILETPMILFVVPVKQGDGDREEVSVMLKDWIDFSQEKLFFVPKTAVVCITIPNKILISDYHRARIGTDSMKEEFDITEFHQTMSVAEFDDEEGEGDTLDEGDEDFPQMPPNEFPGWGGNPRLGP